MRGLSYNQGDQTPNCVVCFCCDPDDDFQSIQRTFMEKHYQEFDDSEENKLVYTSIFNEYVRYFFLFSACIDFLFFLKVQVLYFPLYKILGLHGAEPTYCLLSLV